MLTVYSDRYIISLFPHPHTPFSPSLISLMVFVDVKHHGYLLTYREETHTGHQELLVVTVSIAIGIIIISLFPHLLNPFSASLISLMVFADVKQHVYLLTYLLTYLPTYLLTYRQETHTGHQKASPQQQDRRLLYH